MLRDKRAVIAIAVLIIVTLVSIFGGARLATPAKGYAKTIESLDKKKNTVMTLTAAATASSVAVGAVPGDSTTPISEKLADVSSYFLIVLCAIFFEKYLLSITGFVSFSLLIPAACILGIIYLFAEKKMLLKLAAKIAMLALMIAFVIPVSVKVADGIEETYSASIENTLNVAEKAAEAGESDTTDTEKEEGFWSGITSGISDGVSSAFAKFQNVLSNFMEAVAILIVTSCVIPIAVILFFIWMTRVFLGFNIEVPTLTKKFKRK